MFERSPLRFAWMMMWDFMSSDLELSDVGLHVLRPWAEWCGTSCPQTLSWHIRDNFARKQQSFSHSQHLVDSKRHSLHSLTLVQESENIHKQRACSTDHKHHYGLTLVQESENIQKKRECSTDHAEVLSVASLAGDLADGAESAARVTLQLHAGVVLAWMPVACCHTPQHLYCEHLLFSKHNSLSHFNASSVMGRLQASVSKP